MDHRLVSAARSVKARQRRLGRRHPVLWLFTDAGALADPLAAAARLPDGRRAPGLCGVVFRDDARPDRAALGRRLARLCRARRLALVVAGDARLARALGAGLHRRGGAGPGARLRRDAWQTASSHDGRPGGRGDLIFLSPAFPTATHPGAPALGPVRWAALAGGRASGPVPPRPVLALGGLTGGNAARLGRGCAGFAAIRALT